MTEQQEGDGLSTALDVVMLRCTCCGDMIVPRFYETLEELKGEECSRCDSGVLEFAKSDMMRRQDVEKQLKKREYKGIELALKLSRLSKDIDELESKLEEKKQKLLEEVQNQ